MKILVIGQPGTSLSQMAVGYFDHYTQERWKVHAACIEKTSCNPLISTVMAEDGIDVSHISCAPLQQLINEQYDYVLLLGQSSEFSLPDRLQFNNLIELPLDIQARSDLQSFEYLTSTREALKIQLLKFIGKTMPKAAA